MSCIQWIKQLFTKCLAFLQYVKIRNADQHYQIEQFSSVELNPQKELEKDLKVELTTENYEHQIQIADLETQGQTQNEQLLQQKHVEPQLLVQIDNNEVREFIDSVPNVEFTDINNLINIGNKAVDVFSNMCNDLTGYEQLENNQDEFSYWIKYIETSEKYQIHQMRYTYTLNTTIEKYITFMKDLNLQKQLDTSVDQFECHLTQDLLQINYLRYKKILFMDPRDFLYVKYLKHINNDSIIEISKSIENEEFQPFSPTTKSTTRAYLLLSGNYIKQVSPNKLEITTYSECNMKLKLKPIMTKSASKNEIKKLIKKYRDYFNQQ